MKTEIRYFQMSSYFIRSEKCTSYFFIQGTKKTKKKKKKENKCAEGQ